MRTRRRLRSTRTRPARPYRAGEWFARIIQYGRACTQQDAWTTAKNLAGLYDALCDAAAIDEEGEVPVPRWAINGLIAYVQETATQFRTGSGRHVHWKEKYRQDQIDLARYGEVSVHHLKHGLTWPEAYIEAANTLDGLASGPPRTIEASYKRVARAVRNGEWGRYYESKRIQMWGVKGP